MSGDEFLDKARLVCIGKKEKELLNGVKIDQFFMIKGSEVIFNSPVKDIKVFDAVLSFSFLGKRCSKISFPSVVGASNVLVLCRPVILKELYDVAGDVEDELFLLKRQKEIYLNKVGMVRDCISIVTSWE